MKIFLRLTFFTLFLFKGFTELFAQSTRTCYSGLQCVTICNYTRDARDTIDVCKGDTIKFQGTSSPFDCAGERENISIYSGLLISSTTDRNRVCTVDGEAAPRLTGPNIISQEIEIVRRNSTGCPDYDYNISAKAVITESGLYSIEWERTTRSWNWGTESYDVSTIRVISSRYYRVKGGGVVPSFTVSKKHANIGEAIIITPSVNYTDPNSQSNEFLLTTITTNCGITDSFTERNHWLNASTPFTYQSSRSKVNLYASAIDNGCPPVKGNSQEVFFRPCGRESFGFFDAALEAEVREVEARACNDQVNKDRKDYHFRLDEKNLCDSCPINDVWSLYKSKISNQIPILEDFEPQSDSKLIASNTFKPPYNPNTPIVSGTKINLFDPPSTEMLTAVVNNTPFYVFLNGYTPVYNYSNPVTVFVDEQNRCVTNYTLKGHRLYPGKVTRCLVEDCGQIKIKTFSEGISEWGDINSKVGALVKEINMSEGKKLFDNVDNRFAALVRQRYPQRVVQDLNTATLTNLGIENKNWIVRGFRIKHPSNDEITLFARGDTGVFKVMNDVKMNFSTNGTYSGISVKNQAANGTWSTDGNTAITIDGANAQISSITADSFVIKGKMKSFVDTVLVDADYTMVFQKTSCPVTAVLNPSVTYISSNIVRINWTSSGSGVSYLVEYKPSTSSTWIPLPKSTSAHNFIQSLTLSTTYNVRVIADCGAGSFETINFTTPSPCNVPNAPVLSNITATSARLDWSASGTGSYSIEYGLLNGSPNYFITSGTFSFLTRLMPSTTYQVQISTFCNDTPSSYVNFTTASGGTRPFPIGLPTCLEDDFRELEKLYDATGGNSWTNKTNWFTSPNMATWTGITLLASGCDVATINLGNNNLVGTLPNINLPNLTGLYVNQNKLTGVIPNFNLPKLGGLALQQNQFTGGAPNFNFPLLTYIDISDNPNLGGNVPSLASSTNLQICYAIRSALTGSIPNFSQQNLRILWLSSNQLTGTIPNFNMPILQQLRLNNNQLTGTIPNFNLPNLAYLYINVNQLTGGIPNFTGMPVLVEFFAAANQLSGNIPNFANMPNLKTISLSVNQLTGSIPDFNLPSLSTLFLRKNQLSGNIPNFSNTSLIAAPPAFTQLWLYDNKFVFGDIEGKTWLNTTDVEYEPQAKIPIVLNGTSLSVNTGSANNVQQFTWYKDDVVVATNQNNTFTPTSSGKYYCKISHNTITTTSDTLRNLILQSDDYNAAILPVELLNFQVTPLSKTAYLTWQTASERNASHFDVQRSRDGKTFEKLGQVKAHGNSATLQSYAFTDETPAVGTYYYRLQQVDFDGTTALSNIVSVEFGSKHKLQVFPNPTKDKLTIVSKSKGEYAIFDMIGHEIRRGGLLNNATDVTVSDLPIGFYVVKVAEESVKFFKN